MSLIKVHISASIYSVHVSSWYAFTFTWMSYLFTPFKNSWSYTCVQHLKTPSFRILDFLLISLSSRCTYMSFCNRIMWLKWRVYLHDLMLAQYPIWWQPVAFNSIKTKKKICWVITIVSNGFLSELIKKHESTSHLITILVLKMWQV
jgi:hypothetical protein